MSNDVFSLTDWIAENRKDPYPFEYGGQTFELPHLSSIDLRISEAADADNVEALKALFRLGLGPEQWAAFEALAWPADAMGELFRRWRAHAGLKPTAELKPIYDRHADILCPDAPALAREAFLAAPDESESQNPADPVSMW